MNITQKIPDDVNDYRAALAKNNGIVVDKTDPLMAIPTIIELARSKTEHNFIVFLEDSKKQFLDSVVLLEKETRGKIELAVKNHNENYDVMLAKFQKTVDISTYSATNKISGTIRQARMISICNIIASVLFGIVVLIASFAQKGA